MTTVGASALPRPTQARDETTVPARFECVPASRRLVVVAAAMGVLAGCAGGDDARSAEESTESAVQIVEEIIEAQVGEDVDALASIFADDVVLTLPGGAPLAGQQAATLIAGYGSNITLDISGSAVANDDGTTTVPLTATSVFDRADTQGLLWTLHLDGQELTRIEQEFDR